MPLPRRPHRSFARSVDQWGKEYSSPVEDCVSIPLATTTGIALEPKTRFVQEPSVLDDGPASASSSHDAAEIDGIRDVPLLIRYGRHQLNVVDSFSASPR